MIREPQTKRQPSLQFKVTLRGQSATLLMCRSSHTCFGLISRLRLNDLSLRAFGINKRSSSRLLLLNVKSLVWGAVDLLTFQIDENLAFV